MKKIVNGKTYNTYTAEPVVTWTNGFSYSDLRNVIEVLMKTPKGAYFAFGKGGPMTKYAHNTTDRFSGGADIIPLTEEEALGWLVERELHDVAEDEFGHMLEEA